jgi:hypothetical protein
MFVALSVPYLKCFFELPFQQTWRGNMKKYTTLWKPQPKIKLKIA